MSNHADKSTETLVEEAQQARPGDHVAFEELVARHRGRVLANCRSLTRSDDESEDLAQEVFLKAFFGLRKLEKAARFGPWLQRIKINHCLNFIRKRKDKEFVELDSTKAQQSGELSVDAPRAEDIDHKHERSPVWRTLYTMSDNLRIPLILCDMDGLSYQEAADELGIGLSALKMRLKRARDYFRDQFAKEEGPAPVAPDPDSE